MESSIAEFLMRQLAPEQLPTSRTCERDAPESLQPPPSPPHALRSGARPTRSTPSQVHWFDVTSAPTNSVATAALVRPLMEHTSSAFWL